MPYLSPTIFPSLVLHLKRFRGNCYRLVSYDATSKLMKGKLRKMTGKTVIIRRNKKVALIAHDNKKEDMLEWVKFNIDILREHELCATGTTGKLLEKETGLKVKAFESGPLGGDLQIGSRIAEGCIDFLIFFWDPLEPHPHDPDVKALLRVAVVWNIPVACNRASADFMISSSLMGQDYLRKLPDYERYRKRLTNPL